MLYQLVEHTCAGMGRLHFGTTLALFEQQLWHSAADSLPRIMTANELLRDSTEADAASTIATTALGFILDTPVIAQRLMARLRDNTESHSTRCALAGLLSYFVQPRDFIVDRAPGAYGFLDDAILLRAGHLEFLADAEPLERVFGAEADIVTFLIDLAPLSLRPHLLQSVCNLSLGVGVMRLLEGARTLDEMVARPLRFRSPAQVC